MRAPAGLTTLFCDVGGVLVEVPWVSTARTLAPRLGMEEAQVFRLLTRLSMELDRGEITLRQYHLELEGSVRREVPYRLFSDALDSALKKIAPVWGPVRDIKASGAMEVVALSNMSREVWSSLQKKFRIGSLFHFSVLSFEHGVLKPDPRFFKLALDVTGASPGESLFVDDSVENVRAAKSLGLHAYRSVRPEDTANLLRSLVDAGNGGRQAALRAVLRTTPPDAPSGQPGQAGPRKVRGFRADRVKPLKLDSDAARVVA